MAYLVYSKFYAFEEMPETSSSKTFNSMMERSNVVKNL
jgi:hypothetical protein